MIYVIFALIGITAFCFFLISQLIKTDKKQRETERELNAAYDNAHSLNNYYAKQEEIKNNEKQTEQKIDNCASDADLYAVVNDIVRINNEKRNNTAK